MSVIKNSLDGLNRKVDGQKSQWTEDRSIEIIRSEEEKDTEKILLEPQCPVRCGDIYKNVIET